MNKSLMLISVFILLLLPVSVSANSVISTEYGDGWQKECYSDGKCAYSNHETYLRYDNQWIPAEWLNISNGNWTYSKSENVTHYNLTRLSEHLIIPKSFANYTFDLDKISLQFTVTPAQLASRSTLQVIGGQNYWYITIPDKAVKTRFMWDNKLPIISNETGAILNQSEYDINGTLLWENYKYQVVNGDVRLYYNQTARNFGLASSLITFKFDSWTVGEGGNAWSGNSSYSNFMLDRNTNRIILPDAVTDGLVLYHKMSGSSGITSYDMNTTSNNNGTLTNMNTGLDNGSSGWNSSGKFGNAVKSNGLTTSIIVPHGVEIGLVNNFTISVWLYDLSVTADRQMEKGDNWFFCDQYIGGGCTQVGRWQFMVKKLAIVSCVQDTSLHTQNVWYYVTGIKDNSYINIYVDGIYKNRIAVSGNIDLGTLSLYIASDDSGIEFNGIVDEVRIYNRALTNDEINQTMNNTMKSSGNLTTWYDAGTGNETYQVDVNATTPTSANYTVWYADNGTSSYTQLGGTLTGNNSLSITGTKYQNTDVQVRLAGNSTATPEIIGVTLWTQVEAGGDTTAPTYSGAGHNQTVAGLPTNFSITYNDETALQPNGQWIFATNNSGEWINGSSVNFTTTPEAIFNVTTLNSTVGTTIGYRWYGTDNATNSGDTPIYTLTVTSSAVLYERAAGDSITISEGAGRILSAFRSTSDAITITENVNRNLLLFRLAADSIIVTEGTQRVLYAFRSAADIITVLEYANSTFIDVGEIFYRSASEAITVVEGAARQLTYVRFTSDSISITEGAQRLLSAFRSASTSITLTDSAARTAIYNRAVQQAIVIADNVQSSLIEAGELFIRYVSDTITVTESAVSSFWEGVNYFVSGYVNNTLGSYVKDARVEYIGGDHAFSDAAGYYNISVPSGTRDILSRAVGYRNKTETVVIINNTEQNFTMSERKPVTVSAPGFGTISGLFIVAVTIIFIKRSTAGTAGINACQGTQRSINAAGSHPTCRVVVHKHK